MYTIRLKQNLSKLTHNDKVIADYIDKNMLGLTDFTSYDIADQLDISQAAVIRFSKKLGYDTFQDLAADVRDMKDGSAWEEEISAQENTIATFEKIKYSYNYGLEEVLKHNPVEVFERAVSILEEAETIYCYGAQTSGALTEIFANRLLEIGKNAINLRDTLTTTAVIRNSRPTDVLFVISATGETKTTLKLVKLASDQGVTVISLTGSQDNPIYKLSTCGLRTSVYRIYTRMFSIINRCTQLYLLDCLFISIYKQNAEKYREKYDAISEILNDELGHSLKGKKEDHEK